MRFFGAQPRMSFTAQDHAIARAVAPGLPSPLKSNAFHSIQCLPHDQLRNHQVPESRQNRQPLFTARRDSPSVSRLVGA